MSKRLAILFFGCVRTYDKCYENFFKYVFDTNANQGWKIDIFIHTWSVFEKSGAAWHRHFPTLDGKKLEKEDIKHIEQIYKPKKFVVQDLTMAHGGKESKKTCVRLVEAYEKEQNFKYDYYLTTRLDILFYTPLSLNSWVDCQFLHHLPNKKYIFVPFNPFVRSHVITLRDINEGDLVYFSNFVFNDYRPMLKDDNEIILVRYLLYKDFFLQREDGPLYAHPISRQQKSVVDMKIRELESKISQIEAQIPSAISRIQNHLAYKFGMVMIRHSKSLAGYIKLPYLLFGIYIAHKEQRRNYEQTLKTKSSLKLTPLENLSDFKEALRMKNYLSYQLGSALINRLKKSSNKKFALIAMGGGGL